MLFSCDATFSPCSLEKVLRASLYMWESSWCYKYYAPTGLGTAFAVRVSLFVNASLYSLCNTCYTV